MEAVNSKQAIKKDLLKKLHMLKTCRVALCVSLVANVASLITCLLTAMLGEDVVPETLAVSFNELILFQVFLVCILFVMIAVAIKVQCEIDAAMIEEIFKSEA